MALAIQLFNRLDRKSINGLRGAAMKVKLLQLGRLVSAFAAGTYRSISLKPLIALTAAVVYFLNPFDLIPDFLPGLGLTDDLAVLTWVYQAFSRELSAFLEWEQTARRQASQLN